MLGVGHVPQDAREPEASYRPPRTGSIFSLSSFSPARRLHLLSWVHEHLGSLRSLCPGSDVTSLQLLRIMC